MNPLLTDGLKLLVMGMGTVFVFLVIMIFLMGVLGKVCEPFKHLLAAPAPAAPKPAKSSSDEAAVAAAACAAVHFKRNNQ